VELALLGAQQRSRLEATATLAGRRVRGVQRRRHSAIPDAEGFPSDEDLAKLIERRAEYYLG
jgi:hypothetical protein